MLRIFYQVTGFEFNEISNAAQSVNSCSVQIKVPMFKNFFNAVEAKVLGSEMAALIAHRTPINPVDNNQLRQLKNYEKRHEATLVLIEKKLDRFKKNNSLNIYTKAQLGSAFKYGLLDRGYDQDFCEKTTTWLLLKCK